MFCPIAGSTTLPLSDLSSTVGCDSPGVCHADNNTECARYLSESQDFEANPLQSFLGDDLLFPVFQPIVDLQRGTVLGYEALIRGPVESPWHSPFALFTLAATQSRVLEFELHCVVVIFAQWQSLKAAERLFLNLSGSALVIAVGGERPNWLERVMTTYQIDAKSVSVEITEQREIGDFTVFAQAVETLRVLGASVALDDFGEGHSNHRLWVELKPEFVKIDKFFTQGISRDPYKLEFLRAIAMLGQTLGTELVAEGIEEADDLRILRDLGITHGQGYLLGRPLQQLLPSPVSGLIETRATNQIVVMPPLIGQPGRSVLKSLVLVKAPVVSPRMLNDEVSNLFQTHLDVHALPVMQDQRPIGLINRQSFMNDYARLYFREVHGKRSCLGSANQAPRIVGFDDSVENLLDILKSDDQRYLSDGFIVMDQGHYVGLGTGEQLVRAVTEARIEAARHANPLTFLPGNIPISMHVERLLAGGGSFVACYADLNNFKVFNDHYGYWRGDEMIRLFAQLAVQHVDAHRDFVGHIGGDDFFMLFQSPDWQQRCICMIQSFAVEALTLYDIAAREAGGIDGKDRHGIMRFFPCTTVSIGAVCIKPGLFQRAQDVSNEATVAKHDAKMAADGFVIRHATGLLAQ